MALTTDEMQKIVVEETLGKTPTTSGPEADAFREEIRNNIAAIKAKGLVVDIPREWPDAE